MCKIVSCSKERTLSMAHMLMSKIHLITSIIHTEEERRGRGGAFYFSLDARMRAARIAMAMMVI
jgi:hypothetical protein